MKWAVFAFFVICAEAQSYNDPFPPCMHQSKNACLKDCYCAWCGHCFEVTLHEKDMPPIVKVECGSANAAYTTYAYTKKSCKRWMVANEVANVITLCFLFGFGVLGCAVFWYCYVVSFERKEKDPGEA